MNECKVCKTRSAKYFTSSEDYLVGKGRNYEYFKCENCKLIFNNDFDHKKINEYYPPNYNNLISVMESHGIIASKILNGFSAKSQTQLLDKFINLKKNDYCIDFGAGDGHYAKLMAAKFKIDWFAFDFQVRNDSQVIQYNAGELKQFVEKIGFSPKCITLNNVIEHFSNFEVLEEIIDCCDKNTIIRIITPNGNSVTSIIFKKYWYDLDSPRHNLIFSPNSLKIFLGNYGLQFKSERQIFERRVVSNSIMRFLAIKQCFIISLVASIFTLIQKYIFNSGDRVEYIFKKI